MGAKPFNPYLPRPSRERTGRGAIGQAQILDLPKPAFGLEQPDDPESYLGPATKNVATNPIYVNRPSDGYPCSGQQVNGRSFSRVDQGPLGHARRKFGSYVCPDISLVDLEGPGYEVPVSGDNVR